MINHSPYELMISVAIIAVIIVVVATFPIVPPVFATDVMTVDPTMTPRPMAGHPDHFPVTIPVVRPMAVIWPVADFDAKPCRLNGGPESEARNANRHEQQCFLNHKS